MSVEEIETIKAALDAATPGPWDAGMGAGVVWAGSREVATASSLTPQQWENANLIANAPTWLAELLTRAEAAEARVAVVTTALAVASVRVVELEAANTPPEGWLTIASFPKDRYFMADGGEEWLLYAEDDHGAFS